MLRRLGPAEDMGCEQTDKTEKPSMRAGDIPENGLFPRGLEYNCPVHENWNIVHTGMLIPECHQIYICSENCLRGVLMTADEMGEAGRISGVMPSERDVITGKLEDVTISGVSDVIEGLPVKPRAVQIFPVCMHHLLGADIRYIYASLEKKYPDIHFMRCWMDPIMQKTGPGPEVKLKDAMMSVLKAQKERRSLSVLGDNLPLPEDSDIIRLLKKHDVSVLQVQDQTSYDAYLKMADSAVYLTRSAAAITGIKKAAEKNNRKWLYLPPSCSEEVIKEELRSLLAAFALDPSEAECFAEEETMACRKALAGAKELIGDMEIVLDQAALPRIWETASYLLSSGFHVSTLYADSISAEETEAAKHLKETAPELKICSTVHAGSRVIRKQHENKVLAVGPKAAYFTDTPYFVNWIEQDGNWGFDGIRKLLHAMTEACFHEKDTKDLVQRKGLGWRSDVE